MRVNNFCVVLFITSQILCGDLIEKVDDNTYIAQTSEREEDLEYTVVGDDLNNHNNVKSLPITDPVNAVLTEHLECMVTNNGDIKHTQETKKVLNLDQGSIKTHEALEVSQNLLERDVRAENPIARIKNDENNDTEITEGADTNITSNNKQDQIGVDIIKYGNIDNFSNFEYNSLNYTTIRNNHNPETLFNEKPKSDEALMALSILQRELIKKKSAGVKLTNEQAEIGILKEYDSILNAKQSKKNRINSIIRRQRRSKLAASKIAIQ